MLESSRQPLAGFRHRWLVAFLVLLIGLGAALNGQGHWIAADDDNLWLAAVVRADSRAELRDLESQVIDELRAGGQAQHNIARFEKRREYGRNYLGAIELWRWAGERFVPAAKRADADAPTLARRMVVMFAAGLVAAWLLLGLAMTRLTDARVARGVVAGVALAALWFVLLPLQFSQTLGLERSLLHVLPETVYTLLRPHDGLSVFGFTGRNLFAVLFLALFVLRWAGHDRLAALMFVLAALLHASYATLMLPFLLLCDALNRRKNLYDPVYLTVLGLVAVYAVSGESLWATLIHLEHWVWIVALVLVVLVAAVVFRLRVQANNDPRPLRDVLVLVLLWLFTLPVAMLMSRLADANTALYFWMQIHPRTLGVIQPLIAVALGLWLVGREPLSALTRTLLISLALLLPASGMSALISKQGALPRLSAEYGALLAERAALPAADVRTLVSGRSEGFIYFMIERELSATNRRR